MVARTDDARSSAPRPAGMARLLTAEIISTTGSALTTVALPWFVLTTTGSPARSGVVMAAEIAPIVLFGVISGSWAERVGARRWMLLSDTVRAPLVALVPALHAAGLLPFWALLAIVFAVGMFSTPYTASQQVLVADLVGADEVALARATSTFQAATRLTLLLGPPVAGVLIAATGAPVVLLLDAATYLLVVPLIYGIRADPVDRSESETAGPLAGLRTVYADRLLGTWTTASILSEAAYQAVFVAFPVLALFRYHATATLSGALLAAFGAGAIGGSVLARRLVGRVPTGRLVMVGKAATVAAFLALLPAWPAAGLIGVAVALGLSNGLISGPVGAVRLARIPRAVRAKALTAMGTVIWLGGIVGLIAAGPVLQAASPIVLFAALAVLQAVATGLFAVGLAIADQSI